MAPGRVRDERKERQWRRWIDQWRASAGRVDSVDLRFARQVVVNSEIRTVAARAPQSAPLRAQAVRKRR